jgi:uncharacterized protein (DUF58 family)
MNNRSYLLLFILCGFILSALILKDGRLLLLALPFLVYLMIGFIQAPGKITLIASRTIDKLNDIKREMIGTNLVIKNQGEDLVNLFLTDSTFPSMTIIEGKPHQRLHLSAGETTEVNYLSTLKRGIYSWSSIQACASDPFGLFDLRCDIPASGETIIHPAPLQIRNLALKPRFTLHTTGSIPARQAGPGTDFWGIREFRSGDSLRRINWRLAARHPQKLFTNEYEWEKSADFGLIIDARKCTDGEEFEDVLFEYSVSAAGAFSENFIRNGNRVSLLVFGESMISAFPGYGKKHLSLLLEKLALAKLGKNMPFSYLKYFHTKLFPAGSLIIVFSSANSNDLETYTRLRASGYEVILISPDPIDYLSRLGPQTEINTLAFRAARVERIVQLQKLLKLGIKIVDWQVNKPLETVIQKSVRDLIHRRNL